MKEITIAQIHKLRPCDMGPGGKYGPEALIKLFGGNSITPLALAKLRIPEKDRLWVLRRAKVLDEKNSRIFAADCADHVLPIYEEARPNDNRPRKAIQAAREFAEGKIAKDELKTAAFNASAAAMTAGAVFRAAVAAAVAAAPNLFPGTASAAVAAAPCSNRERQWQLTRLQGYLGLD